MACGTPVICSNTSSLPEVAGGAALLVDPLDVDDIAGALLRVLQDEGLRRHMVEAGYRQVQRFSWQNTARQFLELFEEMGAEPA
jgi:glycosyltransferase involved in cell wall biosynthesis